ncbi:MAG: oligosaccharide flippase family protein [Candidatus Krumholzibacteriia bacterium]
MRGNRGVLQNLSILTAGQIAAQLLNVWALVFLAGHLGAHWFGVIQIGVAFMAYALIIAEWGMATLGVREISVLEDPGAVFRYACSQTGMMLLQAIVVLALGLAVLPQLPFYREDNLVFLFYLLTVLPQAFFQSWIATGIERMTWVAVNKTANSLLYALFILALLPVLGNWSSLAVHRWVPLMLIASMALGNLAVAVPLSRRLGSFVRPTLPAWSEMRRRWRATAAIGANAIVLRIILNVDLLMLGILASPEVAGSYAAASRVLFFLVVAVDVLWAALLPRLSRLAANDPAGFRTAFNTFFGVLAGALAPLALGGVLLGGDIVAFLYRGQFPDAERPFQLLAVAYPLLGLSSYLGNSLLAMGRQHRYTTPLLIAAGVAILGTAVRIPAQGATGAAGAMLLAHGILLTLVTANQRHLFSAGCGRLLLFLVLPLAALAGVIRVTADLPVPARIALGGGIYLALAAFPVRRFLHRERP